jgi:hypothetical protein
MALSPLKSASRTGCHARISTNPARGCGVRE